MIPYYAETGRSLGACKKKKRGTGGYASWEMRGEPIRSSEKLWAEGYVCKVSIFMYLFIYKIQIFCFEGVAIF